MRCRPVAIVAAVVSATLLNVPRAEAAGIVTHAWMAEEAIGLVEDPALRSLLDVHRTQVRAGAQFPDGGYWTRALGTPGGDYGEEAHWQRFVDAYTERLRARGDCGDLRDATGPCADEIAHLMGTAGHGMGDEVWDWLFEPNGPDFRESYLPPALAGLVGPGGLELQMDIVAITRHGRSGGTRTPIPSPDDVLAAFQATGRTDIAIEAFEEGENGLDIIRSVERALAPVHVAGVEVAMPWTSSHIISAPGGVSFAARSIAGYYETIWSRLLGASFKTGVSATAPVDGQRNVPATGWVRSYEPGSHDDRGGAATRIAAVLTSALPFVADATDLAHAPVQLPEAAMILTESTTGRRVPLADGYPRIVPYTPDPGEHVIDLQPAADLLPCTWYRVDVTPELVDARQRPVEAASWTFRTSSCPAPDSLGPIEGTITCDVTGTRTLRSGRERVTGRLGNCRGGQDGGAPSTALPLSSGQLTLDRRLDGLDCPGTGGPSRPGRTTIRWFDSTGRRVPGSTRATTEHTDDSSRVLPGHALSLRLTAGADDPACGERSGRRSVALGAGSTLSIWPAIEAGTTRRR